MVAWPRVEGPTDPTRPATANACSPNEADFRPGATPTPTRGEKGLRQRVLAFLAVLIALLAVAAPDATARQVTPSTGDLRDPSGLAVVPSSFALPRAAPEPLAKAWSDALSLARDNPEDFGYPWADVSTGQLVVSIARSNGQVIVASWASAGARTKGSKGVDLFVYFTDIWNSYYALPGTLLTSP